MVNFNIVSLQSDATLLESFIKNLSSSKFRYFDSRPLSIISQHLYSCLFVFNNIPFAYGHLDKEYDKTWLGLAISNNYQGKGYGLKMMNHLFFVAKEKKLSEIHLAVDCDNLIAIKLYNSLEFKIILDNSPRNFIMRKTL